MAAPQARRELELRLKVTTDAVVAKAGMDQLAQSAERAERAASKAQRAATAGRVVGGAGVAGMSGVVGGTAAAGAAAAGGVTAFGAALAARFGLPTGTLTAAAGGAALAYQSIKTSKSVADAYQDELLTEGQRGRRIVGSVIGGSTFLDYADTITGRGRDMARAQEEGRVNAVRSQAESQIYTTQLGLQGGVAQSRAQANALRGARAETTPYVDRTSAEGERRYRIESQLTALRERGATAERSASAAREEGVEAAKSLADIDRRMNANRLQQAQVQRGLDRTATGTRAGALAGAFGGFMSRQGINAVFDGEPARKRFLDEQARLQEEATNLTANRGTLIQRRGDAATRAAQADAEAARARGPERMRAEAAQLEERAGRAMSAAERVGMASRNDAEQGYLALQQVTLGGFDFADPREIAAAQRFAPEAVARLARQSGRNNPLYDSFRQLAPDDFPAERADDLFRRAGDLRNRAGQSDIEVQAQTAEQGARMAQATADAFVAALRANIPNLIEQVKTAILQGRQAAAGSQ